MKLLLVTSLLLTVSACSTKEKAKSEKKEESAQSSLVELSVEDGAYIVPMDKTTGDDVKYLSLNVKVTNKSDKKAVSSIGKIENIQLAKTDLEPFKQFEKIIPQINSSLSSFKSFTQEDGQKMIKAGENKKADDKAGSKTMNIQGKG